MKKVLLLTGLLTAGSASAFDQLYLDRLLETNQCHHCTLSDAPLNNKDFTGADMSESLLKGINLSNSKLVGAWFTHSRMHDANLEGADLSNALMDYAELIGANLKGAKLDGAQMIFADLTDADLTGASIEGTQLRGVTYCNTTMPDGKINNSACK